MQLAARMPARSRRARRPRRWSSSPGATTRRRCAILVRRHNQRLFRVARGVLRDDAEAEDVVQETYVRAFTRLDGFRGEAALVTWLTRIALNEALGRLRRRRPSADIAVLEPKPPREDASSCSRCRPLRPAPRARRAAPRCARVLERAVDALPEAVPAGLRAARDRGAEHRGGRRRCSRSGPRRSRPGCTGPAGCCAARSSASCRPASPRSSPSTARAAPTWPTGWWRGCAAPELRAGQRPATVGGQDRAVDVACRLRAEKEAGAGHVLGRAPAAQRHARGGTASCASGVGASRAMPSVPAIGPGITPLTRKPSGAHSIARQRVTMSTPALAAQTCTCSAIGQTACGAEMLIRLPPGRRMCG